MPVTAKAKKATKDSPEHIRTFESHGISFHSSEGGEHKGECPFCNGKAFFVNEKEGMFHCKTCPATGNKYTFLQLYYDQCFSKTTEKQRIVLATDRGLPLEAIEMSEYAYDATTRRWLIPVRDEKGSMLNLGRWSKDQLIDGKRPVLMTASCKTHLGNRERIGDSHKVYIAEGPWDCIALEWLLLQSKVKDVSVVWVPGCSNFNKDWASYFDGKEVVLFYDNDDSGYLGMERATETIRNEGKPKSITTIQWPNSFPEKFDIRDFVSKKVKTPKKALTELLAMLEEVKFKAPKKHTIERTSFHQLVDDFGKEIHVTSELTNGLLLVLSVIFSNKIFEDPYNPIWLFLVGPSGSGKTLVLQTCSDSEETHFEGSMTSKTLVSGFKSPDGSDCSLLPTIIGKTLMIEDFTGILSLPSGEQEEIYGVLRSVFNGRFEKHYGHIGSRVYPEPGSEHETCHFTIVAGCTGVIHADARANKGERFIKFHMTNKQGATLAQVQSAIKNTINQTTPETTLREPVSAFIDYKLAHPPEAPIVVPDWIEQRVAGLGQIVASVRAVVLRKHGELTVRPEMEVATRISKQLIKLGQAVAFTLDKTEIDEEVYAIIQRVGLDTCYGWHRDAVVAVANSDLPILTEEICRKALMPRSTAFRCMEDLLELGVVTFDLADTGKKGKPAHLWRLTDFTREVWDLAKIDTSTISQEPPAGSNFKKRAKHLGSDKFKEGQKKPAVTTSTPSTLVASNGHPNHTSPSFLPRKKVATSTTRSKTVKKKAAKKTVKAVKKVASKKQ
jgi:hypothetical protein